MKILTMLKDLLQSLFSKPATLPYPNPEQREYDRFRGILHWNPDLCTGCQLCVKDCPSEALKLFVIDKKSKQFVMRYDAGRCVFCGQCVENCRFNCLMLAHDEWSLANTDKEPLIVFYGNEEDVDLVLETDITDDRDETTRSFSDSGYGAGITG